MFWYVNMDYVITFRAMDVDSYVILLSYSITTGALESQP